MWRRREYRNLIDYIAVVDRIRRSVMNAKEVKGMLQCSDHYAVMARIRFRIIGSMVGGMED